MPRFPLEPFTSICGRFQFVLLFGRVKMVGSRVCGVVVFVVAISSPHLFDSSAHMNMTCSSTNFLNRIVSHKMSSTSRFAPHLLSSTNGQQPENVRARVKQRQKTFHFTQNDLMFAATKILLRCIITIIRSSGAWSGWLSPFRLSASQTHTAHIQWYRFVCNRYRIHARTGAVDPTEMKNTK